MLQRDGVLIRHPTGADEGEWCALRDASRAFHEPWEPIPEIDPASPEAFARFLERSDTETDQKHLICRASDGVIVGYAGLGQIYRGPFCSCYMGYWVGSAFARRGFGRSAGVRLCLGRAFTQLDLHRVEANVIPDNAPSLLLVRSCGFRLEGYSPRYLKINGSWRDHERWAITREDWEARYL